MNKKAEDFAVRLKALVEENYTQVDFNVAFKPPNTIGNMFPFKDRIKDTESQSLWIYVYEYMNSTVRHVIPNTLEKPNEFSFTERKSIQKTQIQLAINT